MNESLKNKDLSPLVQSVLALDENFSNLIRLSEKIDEASLKTDNDIEQARKLMARFAESGEAISTGVALLAQRLQEARAQAEAAATKVGQKADQLQARQGDENQKMEVFNSLSKKVGALNESLQNLRKPQGETLSDEERAELISTFGDIERQLQPLIDEAQNLRDDAQKSRMKNLEQQASSLTQHLINVKQKLTSVTSTT